MGLRFISSVLLKINSSLTFHYSVFNSHCDHFNYLRPVSYTHLDVYKRQDVDRLYDLIIMRDNPVDYYVGITEQCETVNNYYNNNNKMKVIKSELYYKT